MVRASSSEESTYINFRQEGDRPPTLVLMQALDTGEPAIQVRLRLQAMNKDAEAEEHPRFLVDVLMETEWRKTVIETLRLVLHHGGTPT
jgi:hypothetical protein